MTAMTPNTQSVCKQHPLGKIPGGKGLWQVPHLGCEYPHGGCSCYCGINCVAEPTSTGEQPLSAKDFWTEYYKSDPNFPVSEAACDFAEAYTSLTFWKRWAEENTKIVKHWPGWKVELAARPSESTPQFEMCGVGDSLCGVVCSLPKLHDGKHRWKGDGHEWYGNTCAPQTSAEPTCLVCGEVEGNYRHSTETANPHYYHKFNPAAPQPVSGDAPEPRLFAMKSLRDQVDIANQNGTRWIHVAVKDLEPLLASPAPAQGTPEPPKVKEILITDARLEQIKQIRAYGLQAEPTALLLAIDDLLHALHPYFPPPASQTPPCLKDLERRPRMGSAVIIRDESGRVLVGQRCKDPFRGYWVIPGGGIWPNETINAAAIREIKEETGLDIEITGKLGIFEDINDTFHIIIAMSFGRIIGGELKSGDDCGELRWVGQDEFATLETTPINKQVFALLATPASTAAEIVDHLIWALEIMQMYERRLIQFGDPPVLVYSNVHKKRVAEARRSIQDAAKYVEFRVPNIETRNPKE